LDKESSQRVKEAMAYQFSKLNYALYPKFPEIREKIAMQLKELDVNYPKNFGKGITYKLGKLIGWKNAKRIKHLFS
jgi:hypothetical protein